MSISWRLRETIVSVHRSAHNKVCAAAFGSSHQLPRCSEPLGVAWPIVVVLKEVLEGMLSQRRLSIHTTAKLKTRRGTWSGSGGLWWVLKSPPFLQARPDHCSCGPPIEPWLADFRPGSCSTWAACARSRYVAGQHPERWKTRRLHSRRNCEAPWSWPAWTDRARAWWVHARWAQRRLSSWWPHVSPVVQPSLQECWHTLQAPFSQALSVGKQWVQSRRSCWVQPPCQSGQWRSGWCHWVHASLWHELGPTASCQRDSPSLWRCRDGDV